MGIKDSWQVGLDVALRFLKAHEAGAQIQLNLHSLFLLSHQLRSSSNDQHDCGGGHYSQTIEGGRTCYSDWKLVQLEQSDVLTHVHNVTFCAQINNTGISLLLVMGTDQDDVYDTLTEKFEELSNDTPQIDFWLVYGRLIEWDHNMLKLMPSVAETEVSHFVPLDDIPHITIYIVSIFQSHCIHAFKQNVNIKVEAFRGPDDIAVCLTFSRCQYGGS
jgi:hypothetical protein